MDIKTDLVRQLKSQGFYFPQKVDAFSISFLGSICQQNYPKIDKFVTSNLTSFYHKSVLGGEFLFLNVLAAQTNNHLPLAVTQEFILRSSAKFLTELIVSLYTDSTFIGKTDIEIEAMVSRGHRPMPGMSPNCSSCIYQAESFYTSFQILRNAKMLDSKAVEIFKNDKHKNPEYRRLIENFERTYISLHSEFNSLFVGNRSNVMTQIRNRQSQTYSHNKPCRSHQFGITTMQICIQKSSQANQELHASAVTGQNESPKNSLESPKPKSEPNQNDHLNSNQNVTPVAVSGPDPVPIPVQVAAPVPNLFVAPVPDLVFMTPRKGATKENIPARIASNSSHSPFVKIETSFYDLISINESRYPTFKSLSASKYSELFPAPSNKLKEMLLMNNRMRDIDFRMGRRNFDEFVQTRFGNTDLSNKEAASKKTKHR